MPNWNSWLFDACIFTTCSEKSWSITVIDGKQFLVKMISGETWNNVRAIKNIPQMCWLKQRKYRWSNLWIKRCLRYFFFLPLREMVFKDGRVLNFRLTRPWRITARKFEETIWIDHRDIASKRTNKRKTNTIKERCSKYLYFSRYSIKRVTNFKQIPKGLSLKVKI